jgi:type VI secretion system secreted protein Hcp
VAGVEFFLAIDGIEGESADKKHKGAIDVLSWSWAEANPAPSGGAGGGGAGRVQMQDFHFTARTSKASPRLVLTCASGEHVKRAVLTCRRGAKTPFEFLEITFTDVLVSAIQLAGAEGVEPTPVDSVSLAYSRIELEYRMQKPDGKPGPPIQAGWDLKTNKKV